VCFYFTIFADSVRISILEASVHFTVFTGSGSVHGSTDYGSYELRNVARQHWKMSGDLSGRRQGTIVHQNIFLVPYAQMTLTRPFQTNSPTGLVASTVGQRF
jgi:hypothetical protein